MLKRKIDSFLKEWKARPNHKPLIVFGARQTGKTTSIEQFGRENYQSLVTINFLEHPEYRNAFTTFDPDDIIRRLSLYSTDFRFIENNTLILFDEIQVFMDATTSLKFFCLQGKYDVICSGSELGVHSQSISSVAVGFKEEYVMYSLDFEEYLWNLGYKEDILDDLVDHMVRKKPLDPVSLEVFENAFLDYTIVGGYPKIVQEYINTQQYSIVLPLQKELIKDYRDDISKYLEGIDIVRTLRVFDSIAPQLAKENHKFQFTKLGHGARFSSYYGCAEWIRDAGIAVLSNNIPILELPLKGNEDMDNFRIYFSDTSLLIASLDEESQYDLRSNQNLGVYKGALYENIAAAALNKQGYTLYFHRSEDSTVELDFLIRFKDEICPIEVKAKKGRHISLRTALTNSESIEHGLKFGKYNIGETDHISTFPLFSISLLRKYLERLRKER